MFLILLAWNPFSIDIVVAATSKSPGLCCREKFNCQANGRGRCSF